MLISLVGPSRGGKPTLLKAVLPQLPSLEVLDLDDAEARAVAVIKAAGGSLGGWEARWERGRPLLEAADRAPGHVFVDVGAGSLQTAPARQFFIDRGAKAIAVVPPFEVLQARHAGRHPEELRRTEYSAERCAVYEAAAHSVDTSRDLEHAAIDFLAAVRGIMGDAG